MVPHFPAGKVTGPLTDEEPGCQKPAFQNWARALKLALLPSFCFPGHRSAPGQRSEGAPPEWEACASLPVGSHMLPGQWVLCTTRLPSLKRKKPQA